MYWEVQSVRCGLRVGVVYYDWRQSVYEHRIDTFTTRTISGRAINAGHSSLIVKTIEEMQQRRGRRGVDQVLLKNQ